MGKKFGAAARFIRAKEYETRLADMAGKSDDSLAKRAWEAEKAWRRENKLDLKLHRYARRRGEKR